jgi:hypothetical protein
MHFMLRNDLLWLKASAFFPRPGGNRLFQARLDPWPACNSLQNYKLTLRKVLNLSVVFIIVIDIISHEFRASQATSDHL